MSQKLTWSQLIERLNIASAEGQIDLDSQILIHHFAAPTGDHSYGSISGIDFDEPAVLELTQHDDLASAMALPKKAS